MLVGKLRVTTQPEYVLLGCPLCHVAWAEVSEKDSPQCYQCGEPLGVAYLEYVVGSAATYFEDSYRCDTCGREFFGGRSEALECCGIRWCSEECHQAAVHQCSAV